MEILLTSHSDTSVENTAALKSDFCYIENINKC